VKGLLGFLGMSLFGWVGWWLGERVGLTTAVVLSAVLSGLGLYWTRKLAERYLE
jgi:hypothetical protein